VWKIIQKINKFECDENGDKNAIKASNEFIIWAKKGKYFIILKKKKISKEIQFYLFCESNNKISYLWK
jgi:hypothetical protein